MRPDISAESTITSLIERARSGDSRELNAIFETRYFAGMTVAEIAGVRDVAECTVARDREKARLFLQASLR